jgi:Carboxypeptidase regulatory-like domain
MGTLRAAACLAALSGVLVTLPAAASTLSAVNRVAVAGPGVTRAFPTGVAIELHAPPNYTSESAEGSHGTWLGPAYWATENPNIGGHTSIQWDVRFVHGVKSTKAVAWAGLKMGWPYLRKDPIGVPHVVGGRVIGTIAGFSVTTRGEGPNDASYEGSMAIPVARRAYARVRFVLDQPPSDSAGSAGKYLVNGEESPSAWEHGQVFWSFSGARLVGRLQPKKVLVGVRGTVVHGRVHDYFKQPVPGASLTLQRHRKSGWSTVKRSNANRRGRFFLAVAPKAVYRVQASAAGASAQSRPVVVPK